MRRQRNMVQNNETPEKELNKSEISNPSGADFKTLVIRMLKEFREDLNSIKKIPSETKDSLIKIKKTIYRERIVEWMKPRVKPMIWNIRSKK